MFNILFEDNQVIVVEKPYNVPVQGDVSGDKDLLNQIKEYIKEKYNKPGEAYIGLVHRLDRPAGGLVVFARTSKAASRLAEQIKSRDMSRTYYAIVRGKPSKPSDTLVNYLQKDMNTNTVFVVPPTTEGAKEAKLEYKLLQTVEDSKDGILSMIQVQLQTGRSHQIRVQMAHVGCPLYGDQKYGASLNKAGQQLALFAVKLSFNHPTLKDRRVFICYPPDALPWNKFKIEI